MEAPVPPNSSDTLFSSVSSLSPPSSTPIEQVSFVPSGLLWQSNSFSSASRSSSLSSSYRPPLDSCSPTEVWRLFPFDRSSTSHSPLYLSSQPYYLIGSAPSCDLILPFSSISPYHAVLQYRSDSSNSSIVRLYLLDLNSSGGSFIGRQPIETAKFVQLLDKDIISFGECEREFVVMNEQNVRKQTENEQQTKKALFWS